MRYLTLETFVSIKGVFLVFRSNTMSRRCELTGKGVMSGNNVSHANNRSRRRFLPNLHDVTLESEALGRSIKLKISRSAQRSVDNSGGLDSFIMRVPEENLSTRAAKIKRDIKKILKT